MDLVGLASDKYCGLRFDGMSQDVAFSVTIVEIHRYLMDFVFYSGEPMSESLHSQMNFILDDYAFTQNAEYTFRSSLQKVKSPA